MSFVPFKVKAVYEYTSPHEDDLHFPNGQIITVVEEEDEDWYAGEYVDTDGVKQEGIFPRNFVEKYEPVAPPRPVRTARPKKEVDFAAAPEPQQVPLHAPAPMPEPVPEPETKEPQPAELPRAPEQATEAPKPEPIFIPAPTPKQVDESPISPAVQSPPPAAEKPTTGSFRDRIAAFNKAAPPPVPYKPGGNGAANFIRKPFVAPPPSKNAYIPPPQSVPVAKVYRREKDPEITAWEHKNQENAEKAGLAPASNEGEEELPKPTSLKERIALLQKQQAEQASRHADAAAKKEKPKKPAAKKKAEHTTEEGSEDAPPLEKTETHETGGRRSIDDSREESQLPVRRKSSRGPPPPPPRADTDGNEADMSGAADETEGTDTEREDSDPHAKHPERAPPPPHREPDVGVEEDTTEAAEAEQEEEEEDDIDPEVRRKEEIRARMMKMSGGMGMMGMFGPPGGMPMPAPPKKKNTIEKQHSEEQEATSPQAHAPPVPVMSLSGMAKVKSPEEIQKHDEEEGDDNAQAPPPPPHGASITSAHAPNDVADIEDVAPEPPAHAERPAPPRPPMSQENFNAPPTPGSRAPPPLPPANTRPIPPPLGPMSPSAGSASDDELSQAGFTAMRTPTGEAPRAALPSLPHRDERPQSPKKSLDSYFHEPVPVTPTSPGENRRASRIPPPIPGAMPLAGPQQTRGPPPPPPCAPSLSRASTADAGPQPLAPRGHPEDTEDAEDYEGDYDTDMPSSKDHKDALKSAKEEEDNSGPPLFLPSGAPPAPPSGTPRMPPPLPSQPPPPPRHSVDMPRAAPPPPPPAKEASYQEYTEDEYDPYNYSAPKPQHAPPPPPPNREPSYSRGDDVSYGDADDDMYSATPPRSPAPMSRGGPPPLPREMPHALPPPSRDSASRGRSSMDTRRDGRRSMDMNRLVNEHDFIANDIDLGTSTMWWASAAGVPPAFFGRKDILHETEESTSHRRGGKSTTTRDLYVLFPDYSQTIITIHFDPANPADATFEQKHEAPPAKLRPDQLEESHERYGRRLHDTVSSKKDTVVGDGTPAGLVVELLKPLKDALLPIGTRAYGALVYSNQGNSLTSQFDEIRPGDIVTFRNAKFQGKHGPMHAKYTADLGRGEGHVSIVAEWDGAKKKVRAWEQGRESRKVKVESFKLEDLRSGEVKIWRVMGRNWVGWEGQNS